MSPPWRDIPERIKAVGDSQDFTLESEVSLPGQGQGLPRFARNDISAFFGLFTKPSGLKRAQGEPPRRPEHAPALRERRPWRAAYHKDHAWLCGAITRYYQGEDADVRLVLGGIFSLAARISVIFDTSSTSHENRPMAFRITKPHSSIITKSYQWIVSIIGLSSLLAQLLFSIN